MAHIYNDHYGENEKDAGKNTPLTDSDIENIVDVVYNPDNVIYLGEDKRTKLKMFAFLKANPNGTYNLMEIYGNTGGKLTAKSFYNTKKGIDRRVVELKDSLLPTSETYSGASLSDTKVPQLFDNPKLPGEKSHAPGEKPRPVSETAWRKLIDRLQKTGLAKYVIVDEGVFSEKLNEITNDVARRQVKRLGHSGKGIEFTRGHINPRKIYNAFSKYLHNTGVYHSASFARTGSIYMDIEHEGVTYRIRFANHTPASAINRDGSIDKAEDTFTFENGRITDIDLDISINGYNSADLKNLFESVNDFNNSDFVKNLKDKYTENQKEQQLTDEDISMLEKMPVNRYIDNLQHKIYSYVNSEFLEKQEQENLEKRKSEEKRREDLFEQVKDELIADGIIVKNPDTGGYYFTSSSGYVLDASGMGWTVKRKAFPEKRKAQEELSKIVYDKFEDRVESGYINWGFRFMSTLKDEVYGFVTPDGVVYLDPSKMNANTPIHEFGHLFWPAMPQEMRDEITGLLKQTPGWKALADNPAYTNLKTDDQKADEVFNTLLGNYGEYNPRVREIMGEDISLFVRVQAAIGDFLDWLKANVFGNTDAKLNRFARQTLGELLGGKEIPSSRSRGNGTIRAQIFSSLERTEMEQIKRRSIKDGTFMKAPNGKDTNLNERQWLQVRTESFKKWFGDWENNPESASKVVDENGEPLVVYHGARSVNSFHTFENSQNFFIDNKRVAEMFRDEAAYKLVVDGKTYPISKGEAEEIAGNIDYGVTAEDISQWGNLLDTHDDIIELLNNMIYYGGIQSGIDSFDEAKSISVEPNENNIFEVFLNIKNPKVSDFNGETWTSDKPFAYDKNTNDGAIVENIREGGFAAEIDGEDVPPATDYVVGNPNQIKSATDNNGEFSSENGDIRFRFIGEKGAKALDKAEEATTRLDNLSVAREMEAAGKDAKAIKFATGWERGADGKWRYETEDELDKIDFSEFRENAGKEFNYNDEVDKLRSNKSEEAQEFIKLNDKRRRLTFGLSAEQERRFQELRKKFDLFAPKTEYKLSEIYDSEKLYEAYPHLKDVRVVYDSHKIGGSASGNNIRIGLSIQHDSSAKPTLLHEVQHLIQNHEGFATGSNATGDDYNKSAGEVEARNAARRINMSSEQRRSSLASETEDVAREDQIFLYDATESQSQVEDTGIEDANSRFNEELDEFAAKNHKGLLHLGKPLTTLKAAGINAKELTLSPSVLHRHLKKHNLTTEDLKGLAKAIQNPFFVYEHGLTKPNIVIITEIEVQDKKLSVSVELDRNGDVVEVNNISSVHGKEAAIELERLSDAVENNKGFTPKWVSDKENVLNWLGIAPLNGDSYTTSNSKHISLAKVIQDFKNPTLSEGKIVAEVNELSDSLHTPVRIVRNTDEIKDDDPRIEKRKRNSKGWYDPKTGEVVIVLPNAESAADAQATVLHEAVGHKGLRGLLGNKFDDMMDTVFKNLPQDVRKDIVRAAFGPGHNYNGDVRAATEEYLAGIAEKGVDRPGIFNRIVSAVKEFFRSLGINLQMTDGDITYLLWKSKNRLQRGDSPMAMIDKAAMDGEIRETLYRDKETGKDIDKKYSNELDKRIQLAKARRAFVDQYQPVVALEETVEKATGKKLKEYERASFNSQIVQSIDKRQMDDFRDNEMKGISVATKAITSNGVTAERLTDYTKVKHGSFRNERMREQKKAKKDKDFSGIFPIVEKRGYTPDDEGVQKFISDFESNVDKKLVDNYWESIKAATDKILDTGFDGGLITPSKYKELKDKKDYYVPLRGWEDGDMSDIYEYGGSLSDRQAYQDILKKAEGRTSESADPIPFIKMLADSEIMRANKNKMKQSLKSMVTNNKLPELYSINKVYEVLQIDPETGQEAWMEVQGKPSDELFASKKARVSRAGHEFDKPITPYQLTQHQVAVYEFGEKYVIKFTNPAIAQSINGELNQSKNDGFLVWASGVNRFMSAAYTKWNPEFVLWTNMMRDVGMANVMHLVNNGAAYTKQFDRNLPRAIAAYRRALNGKQDVNNPIDRYMNEFLKNGGETGYAVLKDFEDTAKDIKRELEGKKSLAQKIESSAFGKAMENVGRTTEGAARFATYLTSRENGRSIMKSVLDAKNVTVNFNKKGSGEGINLSDLHLPGISKIPFLKDLPLPSARVFQTAYIFFNASIQGADVVWQTAKKHKKAMVMTAAAFYTVGATMSFLARMMMGDDDDLQMSYYDQIPEHTRRNNLIIPLGGRIYATIPLPHILRAFYGMGEMTVSKLTGNMKGENIAVEIAGSLMDDVSPIDIGAIRLGKLGENGSIAPVIPTFPRVLWEAYMENKDWLGRPISKDTPYNEHEPEHRKVYTRTGDMWVKFSELLNMASGGDNTKKGLLNINPAKMEHLVENYFGGLVKFSNKTFKSLEAVYDWMSTGETDFELRDTPIIGKMTGMASPKVGMADYRRRYYLYMDELEKQEFVHKDYKKNREIEKAISNIPETGLLYLKKINEDVKELRGMGKELPEMQDMVQESIDRLMMDAVLYYEKYKNNKEVKKHAENEVF
ncbi:MAG: hypothetical protein LBU37_11625 [Tannerellaceae bacterium]|nr:hypothetical protein [Tannerellaceae bacterium]